MLRAGLIVATLVLGPALPVAHAQTCSCVEWPPERRMAEADQVFLGRYLRAASDSDGGKLRFEVLHGLKGTPGHRVELPRQSDVECERSFNNLELALVFVVKGRIPICAGNFDLDKMMPTVGDYLRLSGGASAAPALEAVKLALVGHLPRGAQVEVYAPALKGKSVQVGGTRVRFVDARSEELLALSGTAAGAVQFVALRSPDSIATWLLLSPVKGKLGVVYEFKRDLKLK
jgi:hypothetical protein